MLVSHASSTVAPLRMCPTNAAAEIHSPLHSPGMQVPAVMRHCERFGAVSKTVDGGNVVREFESLPLRYKSELCESARRLHAEAVLCAAAPEKRARSHPQPPRPRQHAGVVVGEEGRELRRCLRTRDGPEGGDPVLAGRQAQPPDAVVVDHAEGARAPGRVPATAAVRWQRAAPGLDSEADVAAAAHEGPGARIEEPRPRQDAVEVLQELREVDGRLRAGYAADRQQRDAVAPLTDGEAADVLALHDGEVGRADALRGRRRRRR